MNIICNRELLTRALGLLNSIVQQKSQSRPILSNLFVSVSQENKSMTLVGTDLEMGMHYSLPLVLCVEGGHALIPALQFLNILREVHEENINLEIRSNVCHISGKRFIYKLPAFPEEGFPEVPLFEGEEIKLEKKSFLQVVKNVAFAMNKDRNRYSLNSLLLCFVGDTLEAVATDQARLAYSKINLAKNLNKAEEKTEDTQSQELATPAEERYIFPAKAISLLNSVLKDDDEETVTFIKGKNNVSFRFRNGSFMTRLVETQFPRYRNAYDQYQDQPELEINIKDLSEAVRAIKPITSEDARNVIMSLEDKKLLFKTSTSQGEGRIEVSGEFEGENIAVGINPDMIQDFLKEAENSGVGKIKMKLVSPVKPVILTAGEDYIYFMSPTAI